MWWGFGTWKGIKRRWGEFSRHTSMKVGMDYGEEGVWEHVWHGVEMSMDVHPSIFQLAADRGAWVTDYLMDGNTVMWDISLYREVHYWELDELLALFGQIL